MRWLRLGKRQVEQDQGRQAEILEDVRRRFGTHVQGAYRDQADGAAQALGAGDDGLAAAVAILRIFADAAHTELQSQGGDLYRRTGRGVHVDRRNYRPLWRDAGAELRWPLFELPVGLFPYVHVAAAVTVVGAQAKRALLVTDGPTLLAHLFEILDLTIAGWEFGRVWVDVDAATLAEGLVATSRAVHDAMGDPPPLPDPVRELMRRNNTVDVHNPGSRQVVGGFNPGARMREILLT